MKSFANLYNKQLDYSINIYEAYEGFGIQYYK